MRCVDETVSGRARVRVHGYALRAPGHVLPAVLSRGERHLECNRDLTHSRFTHRAHPPSASCS